MSTLIANRVEHASPLCDRLVPLRDACLDAWNATRSELPRLGPDVTRWQQWRNASATGQLIDEIALRVDEHPEQTTEQRVWRDRLRATLQDFGERRFGWPNGYRRLLFGDAFYESSVAFARQARAFDSSSTLDDLWQAMRNVWIGNNLQMLLGVPVCLTQGLFAYSMLYPVTDNVLDALDRSSDDKRAFNDRFGQRLCGHHVMARDRSEANACALVSQIEEEFPRDRYADVWDSILAIHRGQVDSLRQQGRRLPESELCEISFAKGGASVLADLYLVVGDATIDQERFAFGYGVFLQLLDDLQDVTADRINGHHTLFTLAAAAGTVDDLTARLMNFIDVVLDRERAAAGTETSDCLDLIRRNCHCMLATVISAQPAMFSRRFRRSVERQWPLSFRAMRRLRRRAEQRFRSTSQRLQTRRGVSSPLELLLAN
ncbi:MAG TPA: class 1 isoprenoid biosynthesis enzyme [Vicinamibacterales bacterium]|nr:class 1 isoprenoid biosynthesis enzyme [Vicinamibacterales bacterium]